MSATVYTCAANSARNMAFRRLRIGDGVALPSPDGAGVNFRRVDAAFVLSPPATEVAGLIEQLWNSGQIVRVKNSSGSSMAAGTLLARTVSTLTNQTSVTATNSPKAGASVVITMASSTGFEAGNIVSITDSASPNPVDFALVSAVTTGQITVDVLTYDTTTPTVTALPCYTATKATNASAGYADWVLAASLANGAYGWAYAAADIVGLDTHTFSVGAFVYLGTAGAFTTAPTGITATAQIVGEVEVSDASVGRIKFFPGQRRVTKYAQGALQPGVGLPAGVAAGDLLIDQGSGSAATFNAMSGDATINSTGVLTIGSAKVTVQKGGTGLATLTNHALQVGAGTSPVTQLALGTTTQVLHGNASSDPTWSAVALATDVSGTLPVSNGGTGITSLGTGVATFLGIPTSANLAAALTDETGSGAAVFGTSPTIATPVINGLPTGTGVAAVSTVSTLVSRDSNGNFAGNNVVTNYTTTATTAGTTTLTGASTYQQYFTGSTTQTIVLPVTSTLIVGWQYQIVNKSSGVVTVQSSGGNTVLAVAANSVVVFTCVLASGTTAASWSHSAVLGTPASGVLTNCTGLPISTGVSGLGTGQATYLALNRTAPTQQRFTSGTAATYTTPANAYYLRVRMVAGGGGGSGSGTTGAGNGGSGGNTVFGTTLLLATGGVGGAFGGNGGTGQTGSITAPAIGSAIYGGNGSGGAFNGSSGVYLSGPPGGGSVLGGCGKGAVYGKIAGGDGSINTGGGGGGASTDGTANANSGSGGGAGGYVDAIISSPSATYTYTVGTGGAAGTAGTAGAAGGAGADGYIEVTEFYN